MPAAIAGATATGGRVVRASNVAVARPSVPRRRGTNSSGRRGAGKRGADTCREQARTASAVLLTQLRGWRSAGLSFTQSFEIRNGSGRPTRTGVKLTCHHIIILVSQGRAQPQSRIPPTPPSTVAYLRHRRACLSRICKIRPRVLFCVEDAMLDLRSPVGNTVPRIKSLEEDADNRL